MREMVAFLKVTGERKWGSRQRERKSMKEEENPE